MEIVRMNGKIIHHEGCIFKYPDLSVILLEVSGTSFPDTKIQGEGGLNPSDVVFDFTIGLNNIMYIDFSDGTGEHIYNPNSENFTKILYRAEPLHYFQDVPNEIKNTYNSNYNVKRIIRIRFKYPSEVNYIKMHHIGVHGNFPKALGSYNLTKDLDISTNNQNKWDSVPSALKGLRVNYLRFSSAFKNRFNVIPDWIINSDIKSISLASSYDVLERLPNETGMDKIHLIKNLESLNFVSVGLGNNSIADNLKISLIKNCYLQHNRFSIVPEAIYNALQFEYLTLGSSYLTDWGVGFKLNNKLNRLSYSFSSNNSFPTLVPKGIQNCVLLKTVECIVSYRTREKLDAHINAWYDFIIANASLEKGNTKFRNMKINMGYFGLSNVEGINIRPSGIYQNSSTPITPMEKIYKMVNLYGHTWTVVNEQLNDNQVFEI